MPQLQTRSSRPKAQLACDLCKLKKIKCDRQQPCSNCKKSPTHACVYPQNTVTAKLDEQQLKESSGRRAKRLGDRISRLEDLISGMTKEVYATPPPSTTKVSLASDQRESIEEHPPHLHFDGRQTRFTNPSHWETILDEITDIKVQPQRDQGPKAGSKAFYLLSCPHTEVTILELLGSVPSKSSVESLVDTLFDDGSAASAISVVHIPSLQEDCQAFFQNPSAVSLSWLALLFAAMALALRTSLPNESFIEGIGMPNARIDLFTLRSAQCLIKSDYSKPTDHTIQAMLLYLSCEHNRVGSSELQASLVLGMVVRLATSMGYHRDPRHFPKMSPLESEMRRRVWALIVRMDLLNSQKNGLPRSINDAQTDTLPPLNMTDDDFSEDEKGPSPTLLEQQSPIPPYLSYKTQLQGIQAKIFDLMNSPRVLPYDEVLQLDQVLTLVMDSKPVWIQQLRGNGGAGLPSHRRRQAIEIDMMAHLARMVLHRRYLVPGRSNAQYHYSREVCLEASREVLWLQNKLMNTPFSRSNAAEGRCFLSLFGHHFLLAATLLCLDLNLNLKYPRLAASERDAGELERQVEDSRLLQRSYHIWNKVRHLEDVAEKGARAIEIMLESLREPQGSIAGNQDANRCRLAAEQDSLQQAELRMSCSMERYHSTNTLSESAIGAEGYEIDDSVVQDPPALQRSDDTTIEAFDETSLDMQELLNNAQMDIDWNAWDAEYLCSV